MHYLLGNKNWNDWISCQKPQRPAGSEKIFLDCWRKRIVNPELCIQQKYPSGMKVKWRDPQVKEHRRGLVASSPAVKESLKEFFRLKGLVLEGNLEHQEERCTCIWINVDYSLNEFFTKYAWLEAKIIVWSGVSIIRQVSVLLSRHRRSWTPPSASWVLLAQRHSSLQQQQSTCSKHTWTCTRRNWSIVKGLRCYKLSSLTTLILD